MARKIRNFVFILTAIGIITGILLFTGCRGQIISQDTIDTSETVEPVATTDISAIETVSSEETVNIGDISWKISSVEDRGINITSTDYNLRAVRGKFIVVEFAIKNNSEESRVLYDLKVIDNRGRVFTLCLPAFAFFTPEKVCALQEIIPGVENTFVAPFDVSPNSEGLVLELTDLKTPVEESVFIDLGI